MTTTVVVVVHEASDGLPQITRYFLRDLVRLLIDTLLVPLQFSICLGIVRRRQVMADPSQSQVIAESPVYVTRSIVTQQSGPALQGNSCHNRSVNDYLDHLNQ